MNKVVLIGNLTKDPELGTTNSGISFVRGTIAVQRKFTNAEGEREADFINFIAWRTQAENLNKYQKKGNKIAISGWIQTGSYEADDGTRRYTTDIVADEIEFLQPKSSGNNNPEEPKTKSELVPVDDDNLPF